MGLRGRTAVSFSLGAILLAAPAAAAQTTTVETPPPPPEKRIAAGVTVAGIALEGQTLDEAAATLESRLRPRLERPIRVVSGRRRFVLPVRRAKFTFDSARTARRAYLNGKRRGPGATARPATTHSRLAVRAWAARVDRRMSRRPRNARVRIMMTRIHLRKGRRGRTIDERQLTRAIRKALRDPARTRRIRARLRRVLPAVTTRRARQIHGTVITIDRRTLHLRLFKRLRHRVTYRIAIGAAGYETPSGRFSIQSKQVNPAWHAPNRPWAGSMAGRTVPGGAPNNPLKARWLGVSGSVGIHGTAEEWSIGSRASHGCIRMRVRDVIRLYRRVPLGATVLIR